MKRRKFIASLGSAAFGRWRRGGGSGRRCRFSDGSTPSRVPLVISGFLQGLTATGYVDGSNVAIEYQWAEGHTERSTPNWFGNNEAINNTDRIYLMRVNGNKLIIKSPGVIVPVTGATSVVEFETVKAD
jgi:hypothetical protein